ncbi:MAG: CocE/NonD family hydrolase [Gammaproteobacteria bacterium]
MVSVDALGTGVSEGGWELLGAAEQQAYGEAVDWVEQQPWFNGRLGLAGVSYMGPAPCTPRSSVLILSMPSLRTFPWAIPSAVPWASAAPSMPCSCPPG